MMRWLLYTSIAAALTAIFTYQLGILDRPDFVFYNSLWMPDGREEILKSSSHDDDNNRLATPLYAILATTTAKNIGRHVGRLLNDTLSTLLSLDDSGAKELMAMAAQAYGAPEGTETLSVGLYFDNPSVVDAPRWGVGWVIAVADYAELAFWRERVASVLHERAPVGEEVVRAVRIGPGPVLKARIPWRNVFTPMISPMLHWPRGFELFEKGRSEGIYEANNGRHVDQDADAVACEIYVVGSDDSTEYIDYIVVLGDTSTVWEDSFPMHMQDKGTEERSTLANTIGNNVDGRVE
mmetsp:Transcript_10998/g.20333  ORF Transcript_10998/g.20333 Transcript_10998/m.20333 type:complete len:294 (-) Transcript_10998:133-1014(-)|eukprot:CAMPEP_0178741316 /NCGR_PEP_ID=MMETSP0744-20121128/5074_1 /TAXON_ID=913974 /ORGANISM="Nitzschia punctata, Strain CCMP561" /LENGTH=293 /DNA_ID=CAMNT_0020394179 /DNA_START=648 /DNA_END=1529 /DNA_ORIENTATION=+